jgi:uncharacterized peroxidase-related enzyme
LLWIHTIAPEQADDELAASYARLGASSGRLDQIILAHSLRPHILDGHMALYKSVLHHRANRLDQALAEAIGIRVSLVNGCDYCVVHHERGLKQALGCRETASRWLAALRTDDFGSEVFEARHVVALRYADRLTRAPRAVSRDDVERLRRAGWNDGEILEINQVVGYFAYANRTILGLGVNLEEEDFD